MAQGKWGWFTNLPPRRHTLYYDEYFLTHYKNLYIHLGTLKYHTFHL